MTDNRTAELEQSKYKPPYDAKPMRMLRHHIECDCLTSRRGVLREIEDLFAQELNKRDERVDELELKYMEAGHVIERLTAECDKWKAKAEEAGRAMNAAVGLWAKADAENRELTNAINELQKKQPYCYAPEKPLDTLNTIGRYIDELKAERDEWKAKLADLNAELGSGTCEVECFDDGVDEGMDGEWFSYSPPTWYLSCGHTAQGTEKPNFCPVCGKAVKR